MAELDSTGETLAALETRKEPGTLFASISGELDLTNAQHVRSVIEDALTPDTQLLVFDVRELTFMDSSGIALLAALAQKVARIELRGPSLVVSRLIELTALDRLLHIVP